MIDQIAVDLKQLPTINDELATKSRSEAAVWTSAAESEARVEELEKRKEQRRNEIGKNTQKIAIWTKQLAAIQDRISALKRRNAELLASDDPDIDKELKQAFEFLDEARQLEGEVSKLKLDKSSCETRLALLKSKYLSMKANLPF